MNPSNISHKSGDVNWFIGVVENRNDPAKLGRVQIRIAGYHVHDLGILPTENLPWAQVLMPPFGPMNGIGWSPTGIVEGAWVAGFFLDGTDAQFPIIWGVIPGIPSQARDQNIGFNDTRSSATGFPKPVTGLSGTGPVTATEGSPSLYPTTLNKPDVSPYARAEDVPTLKTSIRKTGISGGSGTWSEPANPYAAQYPFNHTFQTESGHLMEFDDTPGAERINIWHRKGSFEEFHPNGDRVHKTVGDDFSLVFGTEHRYSKSLKWSFANGAASIEIDDAGNVTIKGTTINWNP